MGRDGDGAFEGDAVGVPAGAEGEEDEEGGAGDEAEDEPALASAVVESLRDAGYVVTHAADGEEGLEAARGGRNVRIGLGTHDGRDLPVHLDAESIPSGRVVLVGNGNVPGSLSGRLLRTREVALLFQVSERAVRRGAPGRS